MRILLLLSLIALVAAADVAKVEPTRVDRVQGTVDRTTGKIESLQIWDVNEAVDAVGSRLQIGERSITITRADFPALFDRLDAIIAKTAERDAAHVERKKPVPVAPVLPAATPKLK